MEQPRVTSGLVVDVESGRPKDAQDFSRCDHRQLGHKGTLGDDECQALALGLNVFGDLLTGQAGAFQNASNRVFCH